MAGMCIVQRLIGRRIQGWRHISGQLDNRQGLLGKPGDGAGGEDRDSFTDGGGVRQ